MIIDIISYTAEQFAALNEQQLKEVREAQRKKDNLTLALGEKLQAQKDELVKKGIFNSSLFRLIEEKMQREYEQKVSLLKEDLKFYLQYYKPKEEESTPYVVNYALPYDERFAIVREYYMTTFTDANERFAKFTMDAIALNYLGELYSPMYSYLKALSNE